MCDICHMVVTYVTVTGYTIMEQKKNIEGFRIDNII